MSKRIIFINPPYERIAPGYDFLRHITNKSPSLGLLHLAAEVRLSGYKPSIIESDIFNLNEDKVAEKVFDEKPNYVGITLFTVGVWGAAGIARKIKQRLPETKIIIGGPHISSMGPETMHRFPEFDVAVVGEGEQPLTQLLTALEDGTHLASVPSLLYRDGEQVVRTPALPISKDLDELPLPAWDLLPDFPNAYWPAIFEFPQGPVATIAASRGCPFHCKFCDTSTFGAQVRAYSPRVVFDMMHHLQNTYGVRHVMFVDDLFLASRLRVMELCNRIIQSGLKMTWTCAARVDTVKPDLLKLMKAAGCWEISFGLETGSDELLKKMDKQARVAKSTQAVTWTAEAKIRTKGLFMLGYPGETLETIQMTKDFIRRIPMEIMNLTKFTPYPGSPVYRDLYGTNIRDDHWQKMNGMNFVWAPEGMSITELDRHYQEVLRSFYWRPKILWYFSKMVLCYPNHLFRLLCSGMGYASAKLKSFLSGRKGILIEPTETDLDSWQVARKIGGPH